MRKYDYVTDGTPMVDESPAHTLSNKLAAMERETAEWFWKTQAEIFIPEARAEVLAENVRITRDGFLDVCTRKAVWGFVNCFTPGVCSMH
jgi:hypothetical protein